MGLEGSSSRPCSGQRPNAGGVRLCRRPNKLDGASATLIPNEYLLDVAL